LGFSESGSQDVFEGAQSLIISNSMYSLGGEKLLVQKFVTVKKACHLLLEFTLL
jgi:hypothetical protein